MKIDKSSIKQAIERMDRTERMLSGLDRRIATKGIAFEFQTVSDLRALMDNEIDQLLQGLPATEQVEINEQL